MLAALIIIYGFHEPFVQNPCRKSGKGGGLAIYINKRVCDFEKIQKFDANTEQDNNTGEFQFLKIHQCKGFNSTKIIVNCYRSPSRNLESFISLLDKVVHNLSRHSKNILFLLVILIAIL